MMSLSRLLIVCVVFFSASVFGDDPIVEISETDPPIDKVYKQIVSEKDKDVQLTCIVQNKPENVAVEWVAHLLNGSDVPISSDTGVIDPFQYSIDQPSPTAWRVRVQNVQVTDEGSYECRVQTGHQIYVKQNERLRVVEVPQISDLETSSDIVVKEGDKVDFTCNATGRPFPVVRWSRLAGEVLPTGGRELRGYYLSILAVRPEDGGKYKCRADNEAGHDERLIYLMVKHRPQVTAESKIVKQARGYNKELVCNIAAYPVPTLGQISWTRNNLAIQADGHITIRNIPGALNKITSILKIGGVRADDYGQYMCSASNSQGEGIDTMTLMESMEPTPDRTGSLQPSKASVAAISITTIVMLISICLLQN